MSDEWQVVDTGVKFTRQQEHRGRAQRSAHVGLLPLGASICNRYDRLPVPQGRLTLERENMIPLA